MVSWCSCLKGRLSQNPGMSNAVIRETGGDASTLRSHREQTEMDSSTKRSLHHSEELLAQGGRQKALCEVQGS
ncbi:uncharacterized protein ACO6RY_18698 [Pungitius sinensis]